MKNESQTVETTFGKVTIFKTETEQSKAKSRRSSRTQTASIEQPREEPIVEPVENIRNLVKGQNQNEIEKNEDFFGFPNPETSNKASNAQMDELNYFDEQLFKTQTPLNRGNEPSNVKAIKKENKT